jgi:hypothetical protein
VKLQKRIEADQTHCHYKVAGNSKLQRKLTEICTLHWKTPFRARYVAIVSNMKTGMIWKYKSNRQGHYWMTRIFCFIKYVSRSSKQTDPGFEGRGISIWFLGKGGFSLHYCI